MKRRMNVGALLPWILLVAWSAPAHGQVMTSFSEKYDCGKAMKNGSTKDEGKCSFWGKYLAHPDDKKKPVFIYLVGTLEDDKSTMAKLIVERMALQGYVAASVQYPNTLIDGCELPKERARYIFEDVPGSAIRGICETTGADCSRIVVAGFSQGAILGILSKDYNPHVCATYAMSAWERFGFSSNSTADKSEAPPKSGEDVNLSGCIRPAVRKLKKTQLRVVNSARDGFVKPSSTRGQLENITGFTCPKDSSCLQDGGYGWYRLALLAGGTSHCYMLEGGCVTYSFPNQKLKEAWVDGTKDWSLGPNLEWLRGNVTDSGCKYE